MTLVVRCCVNGMPFVIGDLLLTAKSGPGLGVQIPTIPWGDPAYQKVYVNGEGPVDVAQKVTVCGSNLLLGWAGLHTAAQDVISGLYELNKNGDIDVGSLTEFLDKIPKGIENHIQMTGLHRDATFTWFTFGTDPTVLPTSRIGYVHVVGSGTRLFMSYKDQLGLVPPYYPIGSSIGIDQSDCDGRDDVTPGYAAAEAIGRMVRLCGNMLANEITTHETLRNQFGAGFETGYPLNEVGFAKLEEILYLIWIVDWKDGKVYVPDNPYRGFQYSYKDDLLALCCLDQGGGAIHYIPPIYRSYTPGELTNPWTPVLNGKHFVNIIDVRGFNEKSLRLVLSFSRLDDPDLLKVQVQGKQIEFQGLDRFRELIEEVIKARCL